MVVFVIFFGAAFIIYYSRQANQKNTVLKNKSTSTEFCDIGKEYENIATNPVSCHCPDGYEFKVMSMGWGSCPNEGMRDCPVSVLKCVTKSETANKKVCCESYGFGAGMVKCCESYQWTIPEECVVPDGFVGGGKQIVDDTKCQ